MEIRDGFTSCCQVLAAEAEKDASLDPNLKPIVDAHPRAGRSFPAPFGIEEDEPVPLPGIPPERQVLAARTLGCWSRAGSPGPHSTAPTRIRGSPPLEYIRRC